MDRLWRSNSSIISRTGCPPDIVNEEDHNVDDSEIPDFSKWTIPKIEAKNVYKISWVENTFHSAYKVRTVERIFFISKTHEKYCLFSKMNIGEFLASKKFRYLHIGMLLNLSLERVLMLLFSSVYMMLDLRTLKIAFLV